MLLNQYGDDYEVGGGAVNWLSDLLPQGRLWSSELMNDSACAEFNAYLPLHPKNRPNVSKLDGLENQASRFISCTFAAC